MTEYCLSINNKEVFDFYNKYSLNFEQMNMMFFNILQQIVTFTDNSFNSNIASMLLDKVTNIEHTISKQQNDFSQRVAEYKKNDIITKDNVADKIIRELQENKVSYFSCDNISGYIDDTRHQLIKAKLTELFKEVLKTLIIDDKDPNSEKTPERIAKMYLEIFEGRYSKPPTITYFDSNMTYNTDEICQNIIVIRSEITSVCAHHHQPIKGTIIIGCLINNKENSKLIGLSKYIRICRWFAHRGVTQELLSDQIARYIIEKTQIDSVAIYTVLTHGCIENRGVKQSCSNTKTINYYGKFKHDNSLQNNFLSLIK